MTNPIHVQSIAELDGAIMHIQNNKHDILAVEFTHIDFQNSPAGLTFNQNMKPKMCSLLAPLPGFRHYVVDVDQHPYPDAPHISIAYQLFSLENTDTFPIFYVLFYDYKIGRVDKKRCSTIDVFHDWYRTVVLHRFNTSTQW